MNKRQIKKKVKQAKTNNERGMTLSPEEIHFIKNYGYYYCTQKEAAFVIDNWEEFKTIINGIARGIADAFQSFADSLRGEE